MKTILVDDEKKAIQVFQHMTEKIATIELEGIFHNGEEAIEFVQTHTIELAILDIQLLEMDGITLGNKLHKVNPNILLIYITGYEDYAMDAIRLHAAGYLLKPYTQEELEYAIESARLLSRRSKKRIFVKTFGHFDVFVDGEPIMFRSGKAKEMLALLVDRQGGTVNTDQIIGTLWENRPNDEATQNLCSKVARNLAKELKENGVENLLIATRGIRHVNTEIFDCDLYDLLNGDLHAKKEFSGEYMLEYSWAENRMGQLLKYLI